jgi:hypothetical protein
VSNALLKSTKEQYSFLTFFLENNISDLEQISKKCRDTIACYLKIFIILYADDTVIPVYLIFVVFATIYLTATADKIKTGVTKCYYLNDQDITLS